MGRFTLLSVFLALLSAGLGYFLLNFNLSGDPTLSFKPGEPHQWGESDSKQTKIRPFSVNISADILSDLRRRLTNWRQPMPTFDGVGYEYGIPSQLLANIVKYWRDGYDWKKAEDTLNSLPQFQTVIQGLNVHFIHAKGDSTAKIRIPLVIIHGWPGSVFEFYKLIPLLTANKDGLAFDVVAPSIPGYVFSEAPTKPGFSPIVAAEVFEVLMSRLGYDKFIVQGGDWGSFIGTVLSHMFPNKVIGFHTNCPLPSPKNVMELLHLGAATLMPSLFIEKEEAWKLSTDKLKMLLAESGYFHEQATKPDTLGVSLSDSPAGFAGYLLEKFATWAEHVEFKSGKGLTNDELLTNIMLYCVTNHITSSIRFYKESVQSNCMAWIGRSFDEVPTAAACYPGEIICAPRNIAKWNMPRLVQYTDMPRGGHFAAFEEPELFANDLRAAATAFLKVRKDEDKWKGGLGLGI